MLPVYNQFLWHPIDISFYANGIAALSLNRNLAQDLRFFAPMLWRCAKFGRKFKCLFNESIGRPALRKPLLYPAELRDDLLFSVLSDAPRYVPLQCRCFHIASMASGRGSTYEALPKNFGKISRLMVGAPRFELGTPSPPDWCANRAALRSARTCGPRYGESAGVLQVRRSGHRQALNPTRGGSAQGWTARADKG
jgi:hypothetical protein